MTHVRTALCLAAALGVVVLASRLPIALPVRLLVSWCLMSIPSSLAVAGLLARGDAVRAEGSRRHAAH